MCAKIMVVDDDPHTRQLLRIIFTRVGYEVIEAQDGLDALGQLEMNCCPHLVILDVLMPNLDGFTTMHYIRANPQFARLPVMMLSSRADVAAESIGLEAGAQDYLVKPFNLATLLQRVDNLIGMFN